MIVVRLELWPQGDASKAQDLGTATIALAGGTAERGDYEVRLLKGRRYAKRAGVWRKGRVRGFPRRSRRHGPWDLLYRALAATVRDRNPEV